MRFTSIIVTGAFAVLAAAQSTTTTSASAASSAQAVIEKCLSGCPATDVNCQAKCISVPNPNEDQVNKTTACVAKCDQGDGSAAATDRYAACTQKCITENYFSSGATPAATAGSGSGSGSSGSATAATATGSAATGSASGTATRASGSSAASGTGAASSSSSTANAAAPALVGSASFGVVGLIGAALLI
ncbi:hypothetical protein CABS01_04397 [Colletotrichum abscissum]|uniref:HFB protein n=2 Tax=Colletotrichum acutatum species complex TaxID=2707335 RepID=A0A9Q0B7K2_9PEZI|nr:uncharacterized protein CLUP02_05616 [Colletotrichum lupini]XP_060390613.1 uncharacterized protein CABS01_04397 [Colletotrichum abscissum]KAI3556264.1 hypothetical protein CABS02_03547 [Colletotrichum abscissum]KAK1473735.1 hypothetical protein CABS01_04397 [Colletotrichum abscissum]KAK1711152.1 hypothetical protein BDP67DRAFT_579539 [Colletotrichum lupini]UQC80134.1 hypothetical protein CLUP02_05616 [Colletotrichum lupini]